MTKLDKSIVKRKIYDAEYICFRANDLKDNAAGIIASFVLSNSIEDGKTPNTIRREINVALGSILRELRNNAGLTLEEAAKSVNITAQALSKIELGKNSIDQSRYAKLAKYLKDGARTT